MAVVRSLTQHGRGGQSDHHTDADYLLSGQQPSPQDRAQGINRKPRSDDWPFIGSVAAYCRRGDPAVPGVVMLPKIHDETNGYIIPGQFATRLGPAFELLRLARHARCQQGPRLLAAEPAGGKSPPILVPSAWLAVTTWSGDWTPGSASLTIAARHGTLPNTTAVPSTC